MTTLETHLWLDLALAVPAMTRDTTGGDLQLDRWIRVEKQLKTVLPRDLTPAEWPGLRRYSEALGAWAHTRDLTDWMPQDLITKIRGLAPEPVGNAADYYTLIVQQYLITSEARLGATYDRDEGIVFTVNSSAPLHAITTGPWYSFAQHPYQIHVCGHCGAPYTPRRRSSQFCSNACRQASFQERKQR